MAGYMEYEPSDQHFKPQKKAQNNSSGDPGRLYMGLSFTLSIRERAAIGVGPGSFSPCFQLRGHGEIEQSATAISAISIKEINYG